MGIVIEISPAELFDRIGILEIKLRRLADPAKLANVTAELERLRSIEKRLSPEDETVRGLRRQLDGVNDEIWRLTDEIYRLRGGKQGDPLLLQHCLRAFDLNRDRSVIKRRIDDRLGSSILEEKNYDEAVPA